MTNSKLAYKTGSWRSGLPFYGVCTPNKIPLTTIVAYLEKTTGPVYLHAVWYLPFIYSPRNPTVTYHFSDLHDLYSGNRQIYTKCQLQYLYPPQISTSGKCHCVINHQTLKATEYIGYNVTVSAQVTTVTYIHQSKPL